MYEDIRITAKFKPLEDDHHQITTNTDIFLPHYAAQIKKNEIVWRRVTGQTVEDLVHLDSSPVYQCTILDSDCIIEAYFEIEKYGGYNEKKVLTFGPIVHKDKQKQADISEFVVQIHLTQGRISKCLMDFQYNQVQLKNLEGQNNGSYCISFSDLSKCFVQSKKSKTVVFPTLYERIVGLKVFKEILKKGSYSDNNYPLKIIISSQQIFKSFLWKINTIKHEKIRRSSQISVKHYKKQQKPSFPSTDVVKKSQSDLKQDSEDSFSRSSKKIKMINIDKKNMKSSQFIPKQSKESNMTESQQYPTSLQGQKNNYFSEFQNLLYDKDEPQAETLLLNDSFEQFEKKSGDKEIEKMMYIKKKKEEKKNQKDKVAQKLREKLKQLNQQQKKLFSINRSLRDNLQKLSSVNKKNYPDQIAYYKAHIYDLRTQHDHLVEDLRRLKGNEEKKTYGIQEQKQKTLLKIRSEKDLDTSIL